MGGSGKSFIVRHSELVDIQKPFFILDGAIVRDEVDEQLTDAESSIEPRVSYVNQQSALYLPRAAGAIGSEVQKKMNYKTRTLEMFKGYNIVFTSNAVPPSKVEEVIKEVQGFETPYARKFIAVTAPLAEVQAVRMKVEGRHFPMALSEEMMVADGDDDHYHATLDSVAYLRGVYGEHSWTFIENYPHTKKPPKVLDRFWGALTNVLN